MIDGFEELDTEAFSEMCQHLACLFVYNIKAGNIDTQIGSFWFEAMLNAICALRILGDMTPEVIDALAEEKYSLKCQEEVEELVDDLDSGEDNKSTRELLSKSLARFAARDDDIFDQIKDVLKGVRTNLPAQYGVASGHEIQKRLEQILSDVCEMRLSVD